MAQEHWQTDQFEQNRPHLKQVAHRMLGSDAEAEDAVQETWMRFSRSETAAVENMRGWLTTVLSRICLDMLRARQARREEELVDEGWSGTTVDIAGWNDPEQEALMADSVGVAMLVVLEKLTPAERLAFVLHDMFGVSFEEIAPIVERSVPATRQLASRARRRVRGAGDPRPRSLAEQQQVVEAFLAAAREGDFVALLEVLDPDVVFRGKGGPTGPSVPAELHGAGPVAQLVLARGARTAPFGRPALVNGRPGAVVVLPDRVASVVAFTIVGGRVVEMDLLVDPDQLVGVGLS
jgi:RNA polymerase sigma factor (sigma-70 family)